MLLLHRQYGIGSDRLPAPQATALASVIDGIMNDSVPSYRYAAGGGLGLLLALSGLGPKPSMNCFSSSSASHGP